MSEKNLHIISFDVPFPANYGGVIDVFYKIKMLHQKGIHIHLHCFQYGREQAEELNKYCKEIYYYKRKTSILSHLSTLPYIVYSRRNEQLIKRLLQNNYPILMEGLHCCYYLGDERLQGRKLIFRESNIEHHYYRALMKQEKAIAKAIFFYIEAIKLQRFEKIIDNASLALTVSEADKNYFTTTYPKLKVIHLPSFHANELITSKLGKGNYMLYHGNLSVRENSVAVEFLLNNIANKVELPIVIAGLNPTSRIKKSIELTKNVRLVANPSESEMQQLIQDAHIHFLYTDQATGLKLKLLNALYNGRFCLANTNMLHGTTLNELCSVADTTTEMIDQIQKLANQSFTNEVMAQRQKILSAQHSPVKNAETLVKLLFESL